MEQKKILKFNEIEDQKTIQDISERLSWLQLYRSRGIGPNKFLKLLQHFGSAKKALKSINPDNVANIAEVKSEYSSLKKIGGDLLLLGDDHYPVLLRTIHNPPPVISYLGNKEIFKQAGIAVIGSRNCSVSASRMAHNCGSQLGKAGYATISGLALGIDSIIHHASLNTGTIGVMAGGLKFVYPQENTQLFNNIILKGGAIISERPFHYKAKSQDFPRRNRIISGLSLGIVVIEARISSGSMTTVKYGLDQNRLIMAVPGFPLDPKSEGGNYLIKQGAELISCPSDIINIIDPLTEQKVRSVIQKDNAPLFTELSQKEEHYPEKKPEESKTLSDIVLNAISAAPETLDNIILHTGLSISSVQQALTELSLLSKIKYLPQGKIAKIN